MEEGGTGATELGCDVGGPVELTGHGHDLRALRLGHVDDREVLDVHVVDDQRVRVVTLLVGEGVVHRELEEVLAQGPGLRRVGHVPDRDAALAGDEPDAVGGEPRQER